MCQEDQAAKAEKRRRRKQKWQTRGRIVLLLMSCTYYGVFLRIVWTGYLTWIGIAVGTIFLAPNILIPAIGLAGNRTWEKRLGRAFGCLAIATLVVLGALVFWPERPGPWKPYSFDAEIAALEASRAVPDQDNAALRYDTALASVDVNDRPDLGDGDADLLRELTRRPWRAADQPEASAWLDSHATILDELLQIGRMEKCRWPVNADFDPKGPMPYRKLGYSAQLLALAGNRHLGEDRFEEALQTSFCLLRSADHMRQQPSTMDFLVSFGCEGMARKMIRHILVRNPLSPSDIERITHRLPAATNTWKEDITRLLEFDEYRYAQFMAPIYEINEQGKIRFATCCPLFSKDNQDPKAPKGRLWQLYCYMNMPLDPQGVWPMARQESARIAHFLQSGPTARIPDDELLLEGPFFDLITRLLANAPRYAARHMFFDAYLYGSFGKHYATRLAQRRATWLLLGLRQYRDKHGVWPPSLDLISERIPPEMSDDPTSGSAFVYALDGDTFKLYSKGLNRIDEHGREGHNKATDRNEDDIAIWPPYVPEPQPETEAETQEARDEMMKQLAEIYGQRHVKDMLSEPNDE